METITKEQFLHEKIGNFILFIKSKIGEDNNIFKEFQTYQKDIKKFLQAMIQISNFTKDQLTHENIQQYLDFKGVTVKLSADDLDRIMRYYQMFIRVINL